MEKVNLLLAAARLPVEAGYAEKFASHGYDDIQFVLGLTPSGLETLKEETNMPTGHFARLKEAILIWLKREYEPTSTPNTSPTPLNVSSDSVVNNSVGGPNAVAASASSEPSTSGGAQPEPAGPVPRMDESTATTTVPTTAASEESEEEIPEYFLKSYTTWKEARLISLEHSTAMGCSVCQDSKRSGSRYKVLICRTVGSKKRRRQEVEEGPTDLGPQCSHALHWTKNKLGDWSLKLEPSNIAHKAFCSSGQKVTAFELVHDPKFVKEINTIKDITGKKAAESALGGHAGRMDGSVKSFTARRARNEINNWSHKDYEADFCKLRQWGREYEQKNPGGRFRFKLEEGTNRLVGPGDASWARDVCWARDACWARGTCWARTDTECVLHVGPMQVPKMFHKRPGHHQYCPRCRLEVLCS